MSGLEQVTSSVEDVLIDSLQFKPAPGASYITARRDTRWFPSGSDSYASDSGVRVIRFNLTGAPQEWMDPQSMRISLDVSNESTVAGHNLEPVTGPWALFQRVSIRVLGQLVEDINHYGKVYQMFFQGLTKEAREREIELGWGGTLDGNGDAICEQMAPGTTRTITTNLLSGLFSGQSKYLWLSALGPVTVELELARADAGVKTSGGGTNRSTSWKISNPMVLGSVVDLSPDLVNAYTQHLEQGKSLPISFGTWSAVEHAVATPGEFSINQSRAFSRLNSIMVVFSKTETYNEKEVVYFCWQN